MSALTEWLAAPVSRGRALAALAVSNGMIFGLAMEAIHAAEKHATNQKKTITIYQELIHFMLDEADDPTILKMQEKVDFWEMVRDLDWKPQPKQN